MHYFNNLLDCTDPDTDVLRAIRHVVPQTPFAGTVVMEAKDEDQKTLETCRLIDKVFNETNTANRCITRKDLIKRVYKQYSKFLTHLNMYIDDDSLLVDKNNALDHLKHMMRKEQEYSAFIRWTVLDAAELKEILERHIN